MTDTILELTLDELKEYSQHDLVTAVFGKLDPTTDSFRELENRVISDGAIYEPAVAYGGKYLICGNKRRQIALDHAAEFPEWRFKVRVFDGSPTEALTYAVVSNTVHASLTNHQRAIAGARLYNVRKDQLRQQISFAKIALQVGVSVDMVQDADKILMSGNDKCIYAITKQKPEKIRDVARMMETLRNAPEQWGELALDKNKRKEVFAKIEEQNKNATKETAFFNGIKKANDGDFSGDIDTVYGAIYTTFDSGVTLPVADTCAVFMWARPEQLFNAVSSLEADGFTGKVFNFIRTSGKPVNYNVEHLICATKGNPPIPAFQQNLMANINGTALPTQYAEAIAETYKVPILSMLNPQVKHKGTNWDYEPAIETETKVTRKGSSKRKSKQSTNSGRKVDIDDAVTGPSDDVEPNIQSSIGETI